MYIEKDRGTQYLYMSMPMRGYHDHGIIIKHNIICIDGYRARDQFVYLRSHPRHITQRQNMTMTRRSRATTASNNITSSPDTHMCDGEIESYTYVHV